MIKDAPAFFTKWREEFGPLSQKEVDGLNALLVAMDNRGWTDKRWWAYVLATAWHETAHTMMPVREYGLGKGRAYGKPDPVTKHVYYGRGLPQLTWKENYVKMGEALNVDLVNNPDRMLDPAISAEVMVLGMEKGMFTGKGLPDYFDGNTDDPINARRIVNGTDEAKKIANYYTQALRAIDAGWADVTPPDPLTIANARIAVLEDEIRRFAAWAVSVDRTLDIMEKKNG